MTILLGIYSWLVLFVALIAIIKFVVYWLRSSEYQGMDCGLISGFSGSLDLEATIGIIFLIWGEFSGAGFPSYRLLLVLSRGRSR